MDFLHWELVADGVRVRERVCILKTLMLEGHCLFHNYRAAGVWRHHSKTCFTFYNVKFTTIDATISFKCMCGGWNAPALDALDKRGLSVGCKYWLTTCVTAFTTTKQKPCLHFSVIGRHDRANRTVACWKEGVWMITFITPVNTSKELAYSRVECGISSLTPAGCYFGVLIQEEQNSDKHSDICNYWAFFILTPR